MIGLKNRCLVSVSSARYLCLCVNVSAAKTCVVLVQGEDSLVENTRVKEVLGVVTSTSRELDYLYSSFSKRQLFVALLGPNNKFHFPFWAPFDISAL